MKRLRYYLLALSVIIGAYSCEKKQEPPPEKTLVETCSDGIQNQDEISVDCGGVCTACPTVVPPCTQTANTSNFPLGMQDGSYSTWCSIEIIYDHYEMSGNGSSGDMTISFKSVPTGNKIYTTTSSSNSSTLSADQAIISTVSGGTISYLYYADAGQELYVNVKGDTLNAEFCSLIFNSGSSPLNDVPISGFLQCN